VNSGPNVKKDEKSARIAEINQAKPHGRAYRVGRGKLEYFYGLRSWTACDVSWSSMCKPAFEAMFRASI
jgi:hypothetical protein